VLVVVRLGLGADPSIMLLQGNKKRRKGAGFDAKQHEKELAKRAQDKIKSQKIRVRATA
jgi:hypothetical protein